MELETLTVSLAETTISSEMELPKEPEPEPVQESIEALTEKINNLDDDIYYLKEEKKNKISSIPIAKKAFDEQEFTNYERKTKLRIKRIEKLVNEKTVEMKALKCQRKKQQLAKERAEKREEKRIMDNKLKALIEDFETRKEQIATIREELKELKRIRDERVGTLDRQIEDLNKKCKELSKCSHVVSPIPLTFKHGYRNLKCKICKKSWQEYYDEGCM